MSELPTGTVTFLFTDVEGSTRLLEELGDEYADVLAEHRRVLRDACARHGGVEVDTQGDAFFVAFAKASDALAAAVAARDALSVGPVHVRMGLHTGEPAVTGEGYVGIDVHRAARIAAAGHGGQILVSQSTRDLVPGNGLRDLGEHRLKDLSSAERIYQLGEEEFPPLKSLNNSNLPVPPEPLLGRKKELADVLRLIRGGTRLLTITGPGGIGKTRFALDVAAELVDSFKDGVWWIGLAPVRDARLVMPTIAAGIGAKTELQNELRSKESLLLLDNFEQIVDAAPELADLQRACPKVALLVTSREPLHIAGEREYALSPLPESPAVELFRQRADAITPGFEADYGELVDVCDRLDRLPLAIELAAARTRTLSVPSLLERLDQRLPLLTSRRRDVDERQRTLRATIEWSYALLDHGEKDLFARLGVFAGSFDAAAAQNVCDADIDALESLLGKSLLRRTNEGRFFMLETIHEYAAERLGECADAEGVHESHAAWMRVLALEAREQLRGDRQVEWLDRLTREHPNIRAALEFAITRRDAELALAIAGSLGRFWVFRGHDREGRDWLEAALALPDSTPGDVRWRALYWQSIIINDFGDTDEALRLAETALALARNTGDAEVVAGSSDLLIRMLVDGGRLERARELLEEAEARAAEAGDNRSKPFLGFQRARLSLMQGDAATAAQYLYHGVAEIRRLGDVQAASWTEMYLALAQVLCGRRSEARASLRRSLEVSIDVGFAVGVAACLQVASRLALDAGDGKTAAALLARADGLNDAIGVARQGADALLLAEQPWNAVRVCVSATDLERVRASFPVGDLNEAVTYLSDYLD